MRARYPDSDGFVERDGVKTYYEVYENDGPTILLVPTWYIIHSSHWKMQVAYLSRHFRVVSYDPIGNGRSDRPMDPEKYAPKELIANAVAVLDATRTERCVAVGFSAGGSLVCSLAAFHPERIDGLVAIAPAHAWSVRTPGSLHGIQRIRDEIGNPVGWEKYNLGHWNREWRDFVEFFFNEVCSDPHSTKLFEDAVGWAMETTGEIVSLSNYAKPQFTLEQLEENYRSVRCPGLIIHAEGDHILAAGNAEALAQRVGAEIVVLDDCGHFPHGRYPVKVNHLIRDFTERVYALQPRRPSWRTAPRRPKKALYVSSPIGLGHARRDAAIADELRKLHGDLRIDWLAQDPVTRLLAAKGESIHPASTLLANESEHIEHLSGEHELAVFQAIREMDEILLANYMLFEEVVESGQYDLVIGDEAWEIDYHLHENPERKRAAYVWLSDFVGFLPMPEHGAREAEVAADYNAEMIEQIARYPRVRDLSIFIGAPEDIVEGTFGPRLPKIREWTEGHFEFAGYVTGFDPRSLGTRANLRAELGYGGDEKVCIVSVGGSGVGSHLLHRAVEAYPAAERAIPGLRMIVVTGPRIDPASLPQVAGVEYHAYVDRLYRNLAACDLAIVQGGLTTTMELTASKVPFIYVPLRGHFEQNFHVAARLRRYRSGRMLRYEEIDPERLAGAISQELGRGGDYMDVETNGAARAAGMIAKLL